VRIVIVLAALALASCSTPTSPSETLTGVWRIESAFLSGDVAVLVPASSTYQITFENSRISARLDCNTCSGAFTATTTTLSVGPGLACTRASCGINDPINNQLTTILDGTHQRLDSADRIRLSSNRGIITLRRQ